MIHLYGIPNCDTVKRARKWLDAKGVDLATSKTVHINTGAI